MYCAAKVNKKKKPGKSDVVEADQLSTNLEVLERLMKDPDGTGTYGPDSIAAVLTTTSCFAPRVPDRSAFYNLFSVLLSFRLLNLLNFPFCAAIIPAFYDFCQFCYWFAFEAQFDFVSTKVATTI